MDPFGVIDRDPYMVKKLDYFKDKDYGWSYYWAFTKAIGKLSSSRHYYKPLNVFPTKRLKSKLENGIYVWIREGSAAHNLDAIVKGIVHNKGNTEYYGFCNR